MLCEITISIDSKKTRRVTECHGKLWPNVRYADTLMMGEIMAGIETVKKENSVVLLKLKDSEDCVSLLKAKILAMEEAHKTEITILRTSYENKISEMRIFRNRACNEEFFTESQKDPFSLTSIYTTPNFDWQSAPSYPDPVENTSSISGGQIVKTEIATKPVNKGLWKDKELWLYIPTHLKNYEFFNDFANCNHFKDRQARKKMKIDDELYQKKRTVNKNL